MKGRHELRRPDTKRGGFLWEDPDPPAGVLADDEVDE